MKLMEEGTFNLGDIDNPDHQRKLTEEEKNMSFKSFFTKEIIEMVKKLGELHNEQVEPKAVYDPKKDLDDRQRKIMVKPVLDNELMSEKEFNNWQDRGIIDYKVKYKDYKKEYDKYYTNI